MSLVVDQYFLIKPNYKSQVSIKRKWQTGIQTSINKNEKRSALLTWPRRTLKYNIQASSFMEASYIKRKIYKNLHLIWGIPIWVDETLLSENKAIGTTVFPVNSTEFKKNFEVGAEIAILSSPSVFEILTIDSFTDSSITTTSASTLNWSANATIYPILKGKFKNTQKVENEATSFLDTLVELEEEYDEITRSTPDTAWFDSFKGYPILNIPPDWGTKIETTFLHDYEQLRFLGAGTSWTHQEETLFKFKNGFALNNLEDISKLIDFFDYHKGRWGVFWRPSWIDDLLLTTTFSASASVITIQDIEYADFWEDFETGNWLMLIWPDNSYVIKGVSRVAGNQIMLNRSIGKECTEADLPNMLICFLSFCRFAQDEIEIQYVSNSFSDIEFTFQSVYSESPLVTTTTTTSSSTSTSTSSSTISTTSSSSTTNTQSTTSSTASSTSTSTTNLPISTTTNTQSTTTSSTASSTTTNTQSTTTSSTASQTTTTTLSSGTTLDVLAKGPDLILSDSDLRVTNGAASSDWEQVLSTIGKSSGRWYFEITCTDISLYSAVGVGNGSESLEGYTGSSVDGWGFMANSRLYYAGAYTALQGGSWVDGDIIGVMIDLDAHTSFLFRNGRPFFITARNAPDPGVNFDPLHFNLEATTLFAAITLYTITDNILASFKASTMVFAPFGGYRSWDDDDVTLYGINCTYKGFSIGTENPASPGLAFDRSPLGTTVGAWYSYFDGGYKTTGWIGQNFDDSKIIVRYDIIPYENVTLRTRDPKDWTFEASATGAWAGEEVVLDTQTGYSFDSMARKSFYITNATAYNFYRLNVTANNGDATYLIISELEMYEEYTSFPASKKWNIDDKYSTLFLAYNFKVAVQATTGWRSVRSFGGKSAGKWYFECKIFVAASDSNNIGIMAAAHGLDVFCGSASTGWAYEGITGNKVNNNTSAAFGDAFTLNDIIGVAVDLDAGKIWFAKNNTYQASGDPAAGTNEAYSGISGTLYPACSPYTAKNAITINSLLSECVYTPPTGFDYWSD